VEARGVVAADSAPEEKADNIRADSIPEVVAVGIREVPAADSVPEERADNIRADSIPEVVAAVGIREAADSTPEDSTPEVVADSNNLEAVMGDGGEGRRLPEDRQRHTLTTPSRVLIAV
jgi:hypothetical protein